MDYQYLWFRFTQVAMKVSPIVVTLILLAPLAVIFWRMAKFQPKPEAETRAELEQIARESLAQAEAEVLTDQKAAQATKDREFEQMLEQAKQGEGSVLLSSDGKVIDVGERLEELERYIGSSTASPASLPETVMMGTIVTYEERVFITSATASWFALYPRRWVGIVGLVAVAIILGLVVYSSILPARPPISLSGSMDASGMQIEGQAGAPASGGKP